MTAEHKLLNFRVTGEDSTEAVPALYSNFLTVSRVGTDVQFDFIFLDLNRVAGLLEQLKKLENPAIPELQGKTVAKLVMPGATFLQLREHFESLFRAMAEAIQNAGEGRHDRRSNVR